MRYCCLVFILCVVVSLAAQPPGSGASDDPYLISSPDHIVWMSDNSPFNTCCFLQTADIDAAVFYFPIDLEGLSKYDGGNHTITNPLVLFGAASSGFFGVVENSRVENLFLTNPRVQSSMNVGGLAGLINESEITNCHVIDYINPSASSTNVGALIGYAITSEITDCSASGTVTTGDIGGGIVGCIEALSFITRCRFDGTVDGQICGGIAGYALGTTISCCYNMGEIVSNFYSGGIIGQASGVYLGQCYNVGHVTTYVFGEGGLIGYGSGTTVENSFWDTQTSGQTSGIGLGGSGGIGLLTTQMQDPQIFLSAGWDFLGETANGSNDFWGIDNTTNGGYPFLAWETGGVQNQQQSVTPGDTTPIDIPNVDLTVQFDGSQGVTILDVAQSFTEPNAFGSLPAGVVELLDTWWEITPSGGSAGTYDITFDTSDIAGIADFAMLLILKREDSASPWIDVRDLGASIVWNDPFITASGLDAFSDFVIAQSDGTTLPVTLSSFAASVTTSNTVMIEWTTQSESDMMGYYVMRSQTSEVDEAFLLNNEIISAANSSTQTDYSFEDVDVINDQTYNYWLQSIEYGGAINFFGPITCTVTLGEEEPDAPEVELATCLTGNFPNPFNPSTTVSFSLAKDGNVTIEIFNTRGQKVATLLNDVQMTKGDQSVTWDAEGNASGVYFVRLTVGNYTENKRMLLLK